MHKIMLSLFSIIKVWLIAFIILLPIVLSFCKAAKRGDSGNELVNKTKVEEE